MLRRGCWVRKGPDYGPEGCDFYLCEITEHKGLVQKGEQPGWDTLACGQWRDKNWISG